MNSIPFWWEKEKKMGERDMAIFLLLMKVNERASERVGGGVKEETVWKDGWKINRKGMSVYEFVRG